MSNLEEAVREWTDVLGPTSVLTGSHDLST